MRRIRGVLGRAFRPDRDPVAAVCVRICVKIKSNRQRNILKFWPDKKKDANLRSRHSSQNRTCKKTSCAFLRKISEHNYAENQIFLFEFLKIVAFLMEIGNFFGIFDRNLKKNSDFYQKVSVFL